MNVEYSSDSFGTAAITWGVIKFKNRKRWQLLTYSKNTDGSTTIEVAADFKSGLDAKAFAGTFGLTISKRPE